MKRKIQSIIVVISILSISELKSFEYQDSRLKCISNALEVDLNCSDIFDIKTFIGSNSNTELDNVNYKYIDSSDISSFNRFTEDSLNQSYIYNPCFNKTKIEEKLDKNYIFDKSTNSNNEQEDFFSMILTQGIEDTNIYCN